MYLLILLTALGAGLWMLRSGIRSRRRGIVFGAVFVILLGPFFFSLLSVWGELLWFQAIGYEQRFWTSVRALALAVLGGSALSAGSILALVRSPARAYRPIRRAGVIIGAAFGGIWGWQAWHDLLLFLNRVATGVPDPVLGLDTGFYLFVLPFLDRLFILLLAVGMLALALVVAHLLLANRQGLRADGDGGYRRLLPVAVFISALGAGGALLAAAHVLYSGWGVVTGPGWTDVHVRLPAYAVLAPLAFLALLPLLPPLRARLGGLVFFPVPALNAAALGFCALAVVAGLLLGGLPALTQWLVVEPNEITLESPYIKNNIRFTRRGFRLDRVEERQFPATERFTRQTAEENRELLGEIRLWDWRALDAVYKQFQEIRLYYEFHNVDIDRYAIDGRYRQVMISARELNQANLPAQSQTFVNRRFKYTHGYGMTLAPVSDFTPQGLPNLLVKDIPPKASADALQVIQPRIYYGELTRGPVVVNSSEQEFDYPSGDRNVYNRYQGSGGVPMGNLWRKFVFGWMFDGTRFLFSGYPTDDSRVMFHRAIHERVRRLAPFLKFDEDPYVVLEGGRMYWIIDGYTTSGYYPYSQSFTPLESIVLRDGDHGLFGQVAAYLGGANYVRNAVKVVVDAFDGTTDFYVFEPDDPVVQVWQRAFPDLFKKVSEMPEGLRRHVRYPQGFLLVQGLVYAKYHMTDPAVFYNQEDLWVRATEKYYADVQPVQPYYVMWQLPESDRPEFVLILPFTPKDRQVLIGWIAGLSDGDNYGRFLAYKFPKERRVLGPQQVETKIDQDRFLSAQLTLWDQRGSKVIRGNVLAIPIEDTLLYVEPIYLQAETAAYPELRLVALMHGDVLSYGETFNEALQGLLSGKPARAARPGAPKRLVPALGVQAQEAFENYLRLQQEQRFGEAAEELERLRDLLQRLATGASEEAE